MVSWSLSDLKLISELSHMSEFDMVKPENDALMVKYLWKLGCDVPDYPWIYLPSKHRNLQDQIVVGYRAVAEVRCDPEYLNSFMADITQRMTITSYVDPSKMEEMAELSYKVRDWTEYLNDNDSLDWQEERAITPLDQLEPDYLEQEAAIKELEDILVSIRGSCYNASGSLKMMDEYHQESVEIIKEKYD